MINFFQVLFLLAAIVLLVLNIPDYNKHAENKRHPDAGPHSIKWFNLILTSMLAPGYALKYYYQGDK